MARIGRGLYIASKPFILEDLAARATESAPGKETTEDSDKEAVGHAMARIRAGNWNEVLPDFNLSWAENDREACLNNMGSLASISRALTARAPGQTINQDPAELNQAVLDYADKLHAVHFFCPDGGLYTVAPDGKSVSCSVHGSALAPRQPSAPSEQSASGKVMRSLADVTATLTFLPEGLRAVVVVNRK
jgi:hypothetical protein